MLGFSVFSTEVVFAKEQHPWESRRFSDSIPWRLMAISKISENISQLAHQFNSPINMCPSKSRHPPFPLLAPIFQSLPLPEPFSAPMRAKPSLHFLLSMPCSGMTGDRPAAVRPPTPSSETTFDFMPFGAEQCSGQ